MEPQASITMSMQEYRSMREGLPVGGVILVALASFAVGVVIGTSTLDESADRRPTAPPTVTVQSNVARAGG